MCVTGTLPDGLELLESTVECAVEIKAIKSAQIKRVIESEAREKAIARPVDGRLLEIAGHKLVSVARRAGITLKQMYACERKERRRKVGSYAVQTPCPCSSASA